MGRFGVTMSSKAFDATPDKEFGVVMSSVSPEVSPIEAYIAAIGTFTESEAGHFRTFEAGMKADGLWDKCIAIYPFQGSDPAKTGLNLMNPIDDDAAFRITWAGTGLTHDASGVYGFNSAGATYGDTHIIPANHLLDGDVHMSYFNVGANDAAVSLMGSAVAAPALSITELSYASGGKFLFESNLNSTGAGRVVTTDVYDSGQALTVGTRTSANDMAIYKNGSLVDGSAANPQSRPMSYLTSAISLGGYRFGASVTSSNLPNTIYGFSTFGRGLTAGDVANLWQRVGQLSYDMGRISD